VVSAVLLSACRAEEQGRIVQFKEGVYLGKVEASIDKKTLRALRTRAVRQAGIDTIAKLPRASDVRPPGVSGQELEQLRKRAMGQKG